MSCTLLLDRLNTIHAEKLLEDITPYEIFHFLEDRTRSIFKSTRRLRYTQLKLSTISLLIAAPEI
jgi:hypothetical protein